MPICETCLHRVVCGKYTATGGVNKCEHYAEERHGRWEHKSWWQHKNRYEVQECSICGCHVKPRYTYNYCPNCGAKMDGGNEDG